MKTIDPKLDSWPLRIAKPDLVEMEKQLDFIMRCAGDAELKRHVTVALKSVKKALARIG